MASPKTGTAAGPGSKKRKAAEITDDFVYTIYSDDDVAPPTKKGRVEQASDDSSGDDNDFDSDFHWDDGNNAQDFDENDGWDFNDAKKAIPEAAATGPEPVNLESIIQSKKTKNKEAATDNPEADHFDIDMDDGDDEVLADDAFGMNVGSDEEGSEADGEVAELGSEVGDASDNDSVATPVAHPDDLDNQSGPSDDSEDDAEELAKQKAFFAPEEKLKAGKGSLNSFLNMNLSRQILRGITAAGYTKPTPVQGKTIPMALNGKDIVGSAVTGSGKTAAFLVPIFERLLYRDTRTPQTRVVILTPTRELAIQCHDVAKKLATHTNIKFCLAVGGLSSKVQEAELRLRPDVVIGTPGRFIDHMRNSLGFAVDKVEILVLDEADRMLEDGFQDELNEILETLPKSRQTMLFSATMNSSVDRLISVGLRKPHRIMIDSQKQTVGTLVQQFVKLKARNEDKRMGYLVYLCKKLYTTRTIVFFKEKKLAHRARIIFGLLDMSCAELHGSMKQPQRIASVEAFRDGKVSFLLASDVAARGLDIKGVDVVINYEPPSSQEIYLHRVGRTARAGRKGVACTLYSQSERKIVKAVVREGKSQGAKMEVPVIDAEAASKWQNQVDGFEETIEEILEEEKIQKQLAQAEMETTKAENMIKHEDEIKSRPKRTWFQSEKEKQLAAAVEKAKPAKPVDSVDKLRAKLKSKSSGKLSNKDKKRLDAKVMRKEGTLSRGQLIKDSKPGRKPGASKASKGKSKGKGPKNKRK